MPAKYRLNVYVSAAVVYTASHPSAAKAKQVGDKIVSEGLKVEDAGEATYYPAHSIGWFTVAKE
jgi:hypothetical protein